MQIDPKNKREKKRKNLRSDSDTPGAATIWRGSPPGKVMVCVGGGGACESLDAIREMMS